MTSDWAKIGSYINCPSCQAFNLVPHQATGAAAVSPQSQTATPKRRPSASFVTAIILVVLALIAETVALHLVLNRSTPTHESTRFRYFHWEYRNNLAPKYMKANSDAKKMDWELLLETYKDIGKNLKLMEFHDGAVATLHEKFLKHNEDIVKLCQDQTSEKTSQKQRVENAKKLKTFDSRMTDLIKDFDKLSAKHELRTVKKIEEIYKGETQKKNGPKKP